jgi:hypothetical protein
MSRVARPALILAGSPRLRASIPDVACVRGLTGLAGAGVEPRISSTSPSNSGRSSGNLACGSGMGGGVGRVGGGVGRVTITGTGGFGWTGFEASLLGGVVVELFACGACAELVAAAGCWDPSSNSVTSSRLTRWVPASAASGVGTVIVYPQCGQVVSVPALRVAIPRSRLQYEQRNRMGIPESPPTPRSCEGLTTV